MQRKQDDFIFKKGNKVKQEMQGDCKKLAPIIVGLEKEGRK